MSTFSRDETIRRLASTSYDVLVIGAGMTGAGVAVDAASRGLRVALVDSGDIASGTSSKSSKMVHGGLRYLEQRELRLVYENLRERQRLMENRSTRPRWIIICMQLIFRADGRFGKPARWELWSLHPCSTMEFYISVRWEMKFWH